MPLPQPREKDLIFYHDLLIPEADWDEEWKKRREESSKGQ